VLDDAGVRRLAGDHCYEVFGGEAVREELAAEPGRTC
jgi:hypothetical protein